MNMNVHQESNFNSLRLLSAAWLITGLCFFMGCVSPSISSVPASSIDSRYQLQQTQHKIASTSGSPSVVFYQSVLRTTLGSHCQYFPSDSAYTSMISKRCPPAITMLKSFERYSREFDAAYLGLPIINVDGSNHFKDIPYECTLLD